MESGNAASDASTAIMAEATPPNLVERKAADAGGASKEAPPAKPNIILPMLAYTYSVDFIIPQDKLPSLMNNHKAECEKAGISICQIVTSSLANNDGSSNANLTIRAEPKFLKTFRDKLGNDAKSSGGKISNSTVESEDLTRQITDNEARLRALTTLRTRVEAIIATRPGKLSDLLEAEQELARVQGEIDTMNSELALAKARVNMSELRLGYHSNFGGQTTGVFYELKSAFSDFFGLMFGTIAAIIRLLAVILPILIIAIPIYVFGIKKWVLRRKTKEENKA